MPVLDVSKKFLDEMKTRSAKSPEEVIMVIPRPGDRVLLMTKAFYPDKAFRLPSGKMKIGEDPSEAFRREIMEETGYNPRSFRMLGVQELVFRHGNETASIKSYVFITQEMTEPPVVHDPDEPITEFRELPVCELHAQAEALRAIRGPWREWGCWRAEAHDFVHSCLCG